MIIHLNMHFFIIKIVTKLARIKVILMKAQKFAFHVKKIAKNALINWIVNNVMMVFLWFMVNARNSVQMESMEIYKIKYVRIVIFNVKLVINLAIIAYLALISKFWMKIHVYFNVRKENIKTISIYVKIVDKNVNSV